MSALKYKIKSLINQMDPNGAKRLKKDIIDQCGWGLTKYNSIINARPGDNIKISLDEALKIAAILKCEPEQLINGK